MDFSKLKIAVLLPSRYRGGSLRGAKLVAEALLLGSKACGDRAAIVFGYLDERDLYSNEDFSDLSEDIACRPFSWRVLSPEESYRALEYAGKTSLFDNVSYMVPDDGINFFCDCDFWVIISDRLNLPVLPVRSYALVVYDYLQRYEPGLMNVENQALTISAARRAKKLFVTTEFTRQDAIQYTGLSIDKVVTLPMLTPCFDNSVLSNSRTEHSQYFAWSTNLVKHKNHYKALKALVEYYLYHEGGLKCFVTGFGTQDLFTSGMPHLESVEKLYSSFPELSNHITLMGDLPNEVYKKVLFESSFLWHPGRIDNGTFCVVEAAHLGVPSLSSDYPAMREMDQNFKLNLTWSDSSCHSDMAQKLKYMETHSMDLRSRLPSLEDLMSHSLESYAQIYWQSIKGCL